VNERWVCKRCYADNESTAMNCVRCGLTRGADVTAADQEAWRHVAGASPAGGPQSTARRLLRFWWIPVVAVALVVGYLVSARRDEGGAIASGGTLSVDDLRIGDCFDAPEDVFSDVDAKPCSEPHHYELYHSAQHPQVGGDLPADAELSAFAERTCGPTADAYIGGFVDIPLAWTIFTPDEEAWRTGERTVRCVLFHADDAALTQPLRGAGQ
jgi:hypothetical protein